MKEFEKKVLEKEKWFESLKMQEYSDLHKMISDKEKEVYSLQEQLSTTYKDLNFEIEKLQKQLTESQSETGLKDRMLKSQSQAH
jgi:diadenosine tetraphosphate (Ap4A) HIT family hydrolase